MNTDHKPTSQLISTAEAATLISSGEFLWIAGDLNILRGLPKGNWIGGTIPYFQIGGTGLSDRKKVLVGKFTQSAGSPKIQNYDIASISDICTDAPVHRYTYLILPAFSAIHSHYARNAIQFPGMFIQPVVGWVAGMHLSEPDTPPAVIDGQSGEIFTERALAMHVPLLESYDARIEIVNNFEQDEGDCIQFPESGFSTHKCIIGNKEVDFSAWLQSNQVDLKKPLVADYCGAMINVSFKGIDKSGRIDFYAPVFSGVNYRLAKEVAENTSPTSLAGADFSCNCILKYLNRKPGTEYLSEITGPLAFGEIAWMLLNQTQVSLIIEKHE